MTRFFSTCLAYLFMSLPLIALATDSYAHQSANTFDAEFLDTMSKHHEDGIAMMKMAVEKAENQKIKNDAQNMMNDQQREIQEMQDLKEKIAPEAHHAVNMQMPGMISMNLDTLNSRTGQDFDKAYLKQMIKHHKGAVKMSDLALPKAKDKEVKAMAQMMHDKQQREIADMKATLRGLK